ncbi:MAG: rod shape-determining protein MreD [Chloroflexi bacterium]|nr:MAG: rod shape-determining protein MreD [Chloroflexota bacterium]
MNRTLLSYLMPLLLIIASLLQSTAANRVEIRGVKPDLVLLLVVAGALIYGSRAAIVWAFIGGIALDLFSGGPLGSSSLALIAAALVVGVGHHTLSRFNVLVPVTATALGTLVYGATYVAILAALEGLTGWLTLQGIALDLVQPDLPVSLWATLFWPTMQIVVLPAVFYNTALSVALIPLLNQVPELEY